MFKELSLSQNLWNLSVSHKNYLQDTTHHQSHKNLSLMVTIFSFINLKETLLLELTQKDAVKENK